LPASIVDPGAAAHQGRTALCVPPAPAHDRFVRATSRDEGDDLALFVFLVIGAVAGFTLTGGAAAGTALGAAAGVVLLARHRDRNRR
jgi:hypothetical protein